MTSHCYSYRFIYFNVRGAGELCRYTLALSGFQWTDLRYPMEVSTKGFRYGKDFHQDISKGVYNFNMKQLPVLQVMDSSSINNQQKAAIATIGQSHTIAKFVARQHPTLGGGSDPLHQAKVDAIYECCRDIKSQWYGTKRLDKGKEMWFDSGTNTASTGQQQKTLKYWCKQLENVVAFYSSKDSSLSSPWCLGDEHPTLADLAIYHMLSCPMEVTSGNTTSFFDGASKELVEQSYASTCPRLKSIVESCSTLQPIKDWEARRPETFT